MERGEYISIEMLSSSGLGFMITEKLWRTFGLIQLKVFTHPFQLWGKCCYGSLGTPNNKNKNLVPLQNSYCIRFSIHDES